MAKLALTSQGRAKPEMSLSGHIFEISTISTQSTQIMFDQSTVAETGGLNHHSLDGIEGGDRFLQSLGPEAIFASTPY